MVDSIDLRENIEHDGRTYFLQTSYLPDEGCIRSSFFENGTLLDSTTHVVEKGAATVDLRKLAKDVHQNNSSKFQFLLSARDRMRKSGDPALHMRLSRALLGRKLYGEAVSEARLALEKGEKGSYPYKVISKSYFHMGDLDQAEASIEKGLRISPEYPDLHNLKGEILIEQKRCKEAIDCFNRAIGLNYYYGTPYIGLVRAYLLNMIIKEDFELSRDLESEVFKNLERASQLDPSIRAEVTERVRVLFRDQQYEEIYAVLSGIREDYKKEVEDILLELDIMLMEGSGNLKEEDITGYLERIRRMTEENPTYADGFNSLGILYTAKCKVLMDKASEAFRKALEINNKYGKAQKNLRLAENDRQGIFILLKALLD